jgi:hypothetical protein
MYATLLDDPGMINRQLDRYLAVTAADIQAAAAEFLRPGQPGRADVHAGDRSGPAPRRGDGGMTLDQILSVRPSPGSRENTSSRVRADRSAVRAAGDRGRRARPAARVGEPAHPARRGRRTGETWPEPRS